jgi:hypothetical protein
MATRILGPTTSRRRRRFLLAPIAIAALAALFVAGSSANLPGSTFEGNDGNLVVNTPGNKDWVNAPNRVRGDDLASGRNDNSFGQGTKEDDPNVSVVTGSIPPQKSDLTRFYVASESAGGSNFLYLAWERSNVLGSANMDFEINKLAQPDLTTVGSKTLNRSPRDLLITFDFTQGGGNPVLGLLKWLTAADGALSSDCFSANSLPCWGAKPTDDALDGVPDNRINLSLAGFAEGAVNGVDVTDPIPDPDVPLPALTFGEAAINLTASGVFPAGTCQGFGSAFLKSRSSASFPAEVKDFVAPQPVNISNCGRIIIRKVTVPSPDPTDTTFSYTTTGGLNPASFGLKNGQNRDYGNNVPVGSYTVTETDPAPNFRLTNIDCSASNLGSGSTVTADTTTRTVSIGLQPDDVIDCTYTNTRQTGAIKVTKTRKHAADGPGNHPHAGVSFTVNGVTKQTDANGVTCFDGLALGGYTVHETVPAGYHVDGNDKQVTVDNSAACSDNPFGGETVSFHNTPLTNITVSVDSQIDGGTSSTINCDSGESGSTGPNGDGSVTLSDKEPGTYVCTVVVDP